MLRRSVLALPAALPLAAAHAQGNAWPTQPVRLVVPFAAGGPTDVPARLLAEEMGANLAHRIVVENRTGSGIVVGTDAVAKAPKDGNTLLYSTVGHAAVRALFPRIPFDPVADFVPVALVGQIPLIMVVHRDFPARTLPEMIQLLRSNPGRYDYASSGNGGAVHLTTELFLSMAGGLQMNHISFRGSSAAMPDVLAGRVPMIFDVAASILPYVQRGELRALGISSRTRSPLAPDVPTLAEGGVAGFESYTWHMLLAPSGTPEGAVRAANAAVNRALGVEAIRNRLGELAMEVVRDSTPQSAAAFLQDEIGKWEPLIRQAGIRVD